MKEINALKVGATDTPSLQLALDELAASGGGILRLPANVYQLTRAGTYGQFHALIIRSSNIRIIGDGPGLTVLKQTTNDTNLVIFDGSYGALQNIGVSGVTFAGVDQTAPDFPNPGSLIGSLLVFYGKDIGHPTEDVTISDCGFVNPHRSAVVLHNLRGVRVTNSDWRYYDHGSGPAPWAPGQQARVGIHATGGGPVYDAVVSGCTFNGNVSGYNVDHSGADGFLWFQNGGRISVSGNVIRNYRLEAIQMNAGPAVMSGNVFETVIGAGSSVACLAYVDHPASPIVRPQYSFIGNTVDGGGAGVKFHGTDAQRGDAPNSFGTVVGNQFRLNTKVGVPGSLTFAVGAQKMEQLIVANNIVESAHQLFCCSVHAAGKEYYMRHLKLHGNMASQCEDHCVLLNAPFSDGGVVSIRGNTLGTIGENSYHVYGTYPEKPDSYKLSMDGNDFLHAGRPTRFGKIQLGGAGKGTVI